jgi:hypothetical protein
MDMGHMVWTEPTFSRFLLVNLYGDTDCGERNSKLHLLDLIEAIHSLFFPQTRRIDRWRRWLACCGKQYHDDFLSAIKYQSQRFLNLLTYLQGSKGPRPEW